MSELLKEMQESLLNPLLSVCVALEEEIWFSSTWYLSWVMSGQSIMQSECQNDNPIPERPHRIYLFIYLFLDKPSSNSK